MRVGIGLPSAVPGCDADALIEWARRAEAASFTSLGVVDRLNYAAFEPMSTLAAAAAVTDRIGLITMVIIGPLRNSAQLAKEAATVDAISGGRLTLGLSVGARIEDYAAAGIPHEGRGDRLTEQLIGLRRFFERDEVAPLTGTVGGPPLLVGGMSDAALLRAARYADGYVHGGGPPKTFERAATRAATAWSELGRPGAPRLWAQGYFALGDADVVVQGRDYMRDYYSFTGPFAEKIAEGMLATPQAVVAFVRGYAEAGCEELVLLPAVAAPDQLDRLHDALAGAGR